MSNVREKLRSGEPLNDKEKTIHEQGLVSVLKQFHDELDAAVFDAYGWPVTLTDEEIKAAWPKSLLDQVQAIRQHLASAEKRSPPPTSPSCSLALPSIVSKRSYKRWS